MAVLFGDTGRSIIPKEALGNICFEVVQGAAEVEHRGVLALVELAPFDTDCTKAVIPGTRGVRHRNGQVGRTGALVGSTNC